MGSGRMLFGRRSGTGRKTYRCETCGHTARFGLPDSLAVTFSDDAPKCPCGAGPMARFDLPKKDRGAGKPKKRHVGV